MTLFLILIVLAVLLFLISFFCYKIIFYSPKKGRERLPKLVGEQYTPHRENMDRLFHAIYDLPFEPVTISSHDGLTLFGRYYHTADGAPLDICFHGYRSAGYIDFSCGSALSRKMGHNLLLVDQRCHGKSQGRTITFGILERLDCLQWVNYAARRFGPETRITLYGLSMGGATVLMASSLDLPESVKGIVADCPFSSPKDIICTVGRQLHYPAGILWVFTRFAAGVFGGFNICQTTAARSVSQTKTPVLILHGEDDNYVPCHMSKEIRQANPTMVERHTFPGADHGMSYLSDPDRYEAIVTEFAARILA